MTAGSRQTVTGAGAAWETAGAGASYSPAAVSVTAGSAYSITGAGAGATLMMMMMMMMRERDTMDRSRGMNTAPKVQVRRLVNKQKKYKNERHHTYATFLIAMCGM